MKDSSQSAGPQTDAKAGSGPQDVLSRVKLAFLDEYMREAPGYDPYDTSKGRTPDIWSAKRKRA